MDVEARKAFRFGFVLRESDLRRLVDTITEQFQKLGTQVSPLRAFRLKFRNGVVAENLTLEEVLAQENSGYGRIVRLSYSCNHGDTASNPSRVSLEFVNADDEEEPGYVSVRFHVFGHDRDWVFVTSSLLEERIERVRRWAPNQLAGSRSTPIYVRLLVMLVPLVLILLVPLSFDLSPRPSEHEAGLRQIEARWKAGQLKDPTEALLLVERARLEESHSTLARVFPFRIVGALVGLALVVLAITIFLAHYYPIFNFCWGEYLEWFGRREAARKFWLTVIIAGFVISFIASILANRLHF